MQACIIYCNLHKSDDSYNWSQRLTIVTFCFFSEPKDSDLLNINDNLFVFQPNENSASIHVALLLCAALKGHDVKVRNSILKCRHSSQKEGSTVPNRLHYFSKSLTVN